MVPSIFSPRKKEDFGKKLKTLKESLVRIKDPEELKSKLLLGKEQRGAQPLLAAIIGNIKKQESASIRISGDFSVPGVGGLKDFLPDVIDVYNQLTEKTVCFPDNIEILNIILGHLQIIEKTVDQHNAPQLGELINLVAKNIGEQKAEQERKLQESQAKKRNNKSALFDNSSEVGSESVSSSVSSRSYKKLSPLPVTKGAGNMKQLLPSFLKTKVPDSIKNFINEMELKINKLKEAKNREEIDSIKKQVEQLSSKFKKEYPLLINCTQVKNIISKYDKACRDTRYLTTLAVEIRSPSPVQLKVAEKNNSPLQSQVDRQLFCDSEESSPIDKKKNEYYEALERLSEARWQVDLLCGKDVSKEIKNEAWENLSEARWHVDLLRVVSVKSRPV